MTPGLVVKADWSGLLRNDCTLAPGLEWLGTSLSVLYTAAPLPAGPLQRLHSMHSPSSAQLLLLLRLLAPEMLFSGMLLMLEPLSLATLP